ncbi:MAG: zinc-dependent metalloprotease [Myxococcales bacterium]|nr:zinc-dependent metalloprotease [Myxococcales bacterium]
MQRNLNLRSGWGLALVALLAVVGGCAEAVGDIDRTQPNLIHKSVFEGQWYVRQTMIDVPPTSINSFVGAASDMEMIRWELQEDLLIGYRSYEKVPGTNEAADSEGATVGNTPVKEGYEEGENQEYKENPIVAYPVSHIDVQRDYNSRTGEQTNVISENTSDRPWYERAYVRVDWNSPQVTNYFFLRHASDYGFDTSYFVQASESSPDAFRLEKDENGKVNYFDFTERVFADPYNSCLFELYGQGIGDCTGEELKVRSSFLKVDEARERDYAPVVWDDRQMGKFGYFRTERHTYDRKRGVTWDGEIYLAQVHDIWKGSMDEEGNAVPHAKRQLRPLVYTLSENYPEEMLPITEEIAAEWDRVLKVAASNARGQSIEQLTADLEKQTGGTCLYCLDKNEDNHARNGDLRYNFIYWVDNTQQRGPLGFGPSYANPETGRLVSGTAYVYGAAVDTYAQYALDIIDLLNGDITEEDLKGADYIRSQVAGRRQAIDPRQLAKLDALHIDDAQFTEKLLGDQSFERFTTLQDKGLPSARPGFAQAQFNKIKGTTMETALITDEVLAGMGAFASGQKGNIELTADMVEEYSPVKWANESVEKDRKLQDFAAAHNLWLADFADPTIIGLAKELKNSGLDRDALYQKLREQIYKGVMLHEIGHTMGLRHNFGGSADPLNYFDEYWPLRQETEFVMNKQQLSVADLMLYNCSVVTGENAEACAKQEDGKMVEYQYSTIMDYGGRFNSDIHGLGRYDEAAIAAGYGDLVQVFTDEATQAMVPGWSNELRTIAEFSNPLYGALGEYFHYATYPQLFGGAENMAKRQYIPRAEYDKFKEMNDAEIEAAAVAGREPVLQGPVRVPYFACYDDYRDASPLCHTWDVGADEYEITRGWTEYYNQYYVFDAFGRDKITFRANAVYSRVLNRYFLPIQNMYQHWIFGGYPQGSIQGTYAQIAMIEGFETIWNALATPSYGSYQKQGDMYVRTSYEQRADADLYVPPGMGRRPFTRYDYESGYYLFNRTVEAGSFWTQLAAITAMVWNDSPVGIGQDTDADFNAYSLPYYLVFQPQVDKLFGSVLSSDSKSYGMQVVGGQVVPHSELLAPLEENEVDGYVDSDPQWSTRLYSMLYGFALLSANYDISFAQSAQVAIEGSGEVLQPSPGFEAVRFEDPNNGRVYVAYRGLADDGRRWIAAERLDKLNELKADPNTPSWQIDNEVRDLEIMRGMYDAFGKAF